MTLNEKLNLGFFPTPIHYLKNLSKKYSNYNLYIKRDDQTGLATGGNKTRKLEYLLNDAVKKGADVILTAGAQQSNHCRQTAAACSKLGIESHLLLGGNEPEIYNGNLLLSSMCGAVLHFTGENRKGEDLEDLKNQLTVLGYKPYIIPYGGSNIIGALGYVNAIKELKEQLIIEKLHIDYIFFATSSGGTQAGIILGMEKFNLKTKIMAIQIDKDELSSLTLEENIFNILKDGQKLFKLDKEFNLSDINVIKKYNKTGYGNLSENERNSILEMSQNEGIFLDPVYTGRAFNGMLDFIKNNLIPKNSNILFWHTGGFPANFVYSERFISQKNEIINEKIPMYT